MRFFVLFSLLAIVLIAVIFWDRTASRADVVFVNRGDVFTLDPQRMSYVQDFRLAYALYEGLVRWNCDDLSIEPAAADLPDISADQRTYTFRIRASAKWSNGDPVTAHDFVYSWKRLLWPDTAADYSNLFFVVEGAEEFFRWRNEQLSSFVRQPPESPPAAEAASPRPTALAMFEDAQRRFDETVAIRAIDDRTLEVRLRRATPYFLDVLCFAACYPVHRPTVEGWPAAAALREANRQRGWIGATPPPWNDRRFVKLNGRTGRLEQLHEWARPDSLVSNGPYVLQEWRYKRDLRLARNPFFHTPGIVRNDSVLILSIEDANTAVLAYESGKIDWLGDVAVEYQADMLAQRQRYEERHRAAIAPSLDAGRDIDTTLASLAAPRRDERRNIHVRPTFGTDFYNFNCRPTLADGRANPFAEARVRRAFALAVDKEAIVRSATRLNEPVMNTLIPPGSINGYLSPQGLAPNAERARAELAAAGWIDRNNDGVVENERGEPFPVVDLLWTTGSSRYKWMSLALKSQWERELRVRVELRSADTKFYKEDLKIGKFMIARGRWYGDYGDPTTFLDINRTGDGNNDRGYSNPRFDALMDAAATTADAAARMALLQDAERLLFEEEMPLVPICQLVQLYMYEPGRMRGLSSHPRLIQYFWKIEITR